ncbi:hypothetical protein C6W10_21900 [Plantactinospora sp. BB1]|nr:hypothetical protein C6W10_21900 [Plantactinospora sp. BB1]
MVTRSTADGSTWSAGPHARCGADAASTVVGHRGRGCHETVIGPRKPLHIAARGWLQYRRRQEGRGDYGSATSCRTGASNRGRVHRPPGPGVPGAGVGSTGRGRAGVPESVGARHAATRGDRRGRRRPALGRAPAPAAKRYPCRFACADGTAPGAVPGCPRGAGAAGSARSAWGSAGAGGACSERAVTGLWPLPDDGSWSGPPSRRQTPRIHQDQVLADQVVAQLVQDERTRLQDIAVEVQNGVAILTGRVDTAELIFVAGALAWQAMGIADVCNALESRDGDDLAGS